MGAMTASITNIQRLTSYKHASGVLTCQVLS
jgi:hypothetical protein